MLFPLALPSPNLAAEPTLTLDDCYRRHREAVYCTCMRYAAGRKDWAEDATHDVFLRLLAKLPELTAHDDLGGWLYRVTANLCISKLRREQRFFSWVRTRDAELPPLAEGPAAADTTDEATAALATLGALAARERVAFCMKVLDGKSQRQIAEDLGLSEGYVSKLIRRAWAQIRARGWEGGDEPT